MRRIPTVLAGAALVFMLSVGYALGQGETGARWHQMPQGYMAPYGDNEAACVATNSDPCKMRFAVDTNALAGNDFNLGGISGNLKRSDTVHEEFAEVKLQLSPNRRGGAVTIDVRKDSGAQGTDQVAFFGDGGIVFRRPVTFADGSRIEGTSAVSIMRSGNGRVILAVQDDGNLVLYVDGVAVKALWGLPEDKLF